MPLSPRDEWYESPDGYIHRGYCFSLSHKNDALASSGVYKYLFRPINGHDAHLDLYMVSSTGAPLLVELYEAPTISNAGTLQTARNRKRSATNVPDTLSVYAGATASNDGTLLEATRVIGERRTGSTDFADRGEWLLKPSTDYLLRLENESNGEVDTVLNLVWYEEQ